MLDFLNSIEIVAPVVETKEVVRTKQETNPTNGADFRVFADGRIYPSVKLVEEYNLEYVNKGAVTGNGFDVFTTKAWTQYPEGTTSHAILIASVAKSETKVDVFSQTRYNADNTPVSSVVDQATKTFGAELLEMIKDVYGVEIPEGSNHVDLKIVREQVVKSPNDIYYVPKKVVKGANAGTIVPVRRENLVLNPLVVFVHVVSTESNIISE